MSEARPTEHRAHLRPPHPAGNRVSAAAAGIHDTCRLVRTNLVFRFQIHCLALTESPSVDSVMSSITGCSKGL